MKQWVISLGAGKDQRLLLEAIHRAGYFSWAFDKNSEAECRNLADQFKAHSNRDWQSILMDVDPEKVAGVMAAGTEVPDVMALLGQRLGCPNIPPLVGVILKDKLLYKRALKAAGVPHTEAHEIQGGAVKALFDQLSYEVVVKPRVSSGSRGVFLNRHDPMGLVGQLADSAEADHSWLIMERYQPGPEISAETLIWDGWAFNVAFVDRFYVSFGREVGGCSPSYWQKEEPAATKVIQAAADALGIRRGTIKSDLVLTEKGPVIIELTARLSGGPLSKIVEMSTGVDYFRQAVHIACGVEPDWLMLAPRRRERVALDMNGNPLSWDETREFIWREPGKCKT